MTVQNNAAEKRPFEAEVAKILQIVVHSLYSEKQIFLRELISNASDACDRLRFEALTDPKLSPASGALRIALQPDPKARTLTLHDNGIGMTKQEMMDHLGTIARSGTSNFLKQMTGDQAKDMQLIGQFGVGFYSAFMVADKVEVISRKAGSNEAWHWMSDGVSGYEIEPGERDAAGTTIILHMKKDEGEFLDEVRLAYIVKKYSDHVPYPIFFANEVTGKGKDAILTPLNRAEALWTRQPSDVTPEEYQAFYRDLTLAGDSPEEPWMTIHSHVEGQLSYKIVFFIPQKRPIDLFNPDRQSSVKLYIQRVLISDRCQDLLPPYLRFVRGIIDSSDLSLNVSREMLQQTGLLQKIRQSLTKRVLSELKKRFEKDPKSYAEFWQNFGAVLKEGLYEDHENREQILELCLFDHLLDDAPMTLKDYVAAMNEQQNEIFYLTGDADQSLKDHPHVEGFAAKKIDVLLLKDAVDEFWLPMVGGYAGKEFQSVTRGQIDLEKFAKVIAPKTPDKKEDISFVKDVKTILGDRIKDVRLSNRLTKSAVCLVADNDDMDLRMSRLLEGTRHIPNALPRILEVNPNHPLLQKAIAYHQEKGQDKMIENLAMILLDQARIMEGEKLDDPAAFAQRFNEVLSQSF